MNLQNRGEIMLQSANPRDILLLNPGFLSHPYDRRATLEATRAVMDFSESAAFAKDTVGVVDVPKSKSVEDLMVLCCPFP